METHRSLRTITRQKPFHNLDNFWDDALAGGETRHFIAKETCILLPLVGDTITTQRLSPGQVQDRLLQPRDGLALWDLD
jgi:hypothetical protein